MFPNATERAAAIVACNPPGPTDPNPTANKECYFDFAVTGDASLAQGTSGSKAEVQNTQSDLGSMKICCIYIPCLFVLVQNH